MEWYHRYSRRIEDSRLPESQEQRHAYAQMVGEDGFQLLDLLQDRTHDPKQTSCPEWKPCGGS